MTRAAFYEGSRQFAVHESASAPPQAGEVQVEVAYTGLCGTDLHILHGAMDSRVSVPAVIGHEMSGFVSAVGDGVQGWGSGDLVTVMPLDWCGTCPACRAGHSHICQNLNFVGIDSPGSLQQRWNVRSDWLVRVPENLSARDAALAEPTAVAVHDVRRAGLRPGERTLVVGAGPIGVLVALAARAEGADVILVEPDAFRREVAESLSFTTLDPSAGAVPEYVEEWTAGAGAHLAFEVSGSQPGLDSALWALGVRGRLVVVGIHPVARELSLHRVFWRELSIIGARVYERTDFETALELLARGTIPADVLISRVLPLDAISDAFAAMESGGEVMKVLIDCQGGVR
jgi:(R,R)-butanediol dehydrogenase/meso-butanediol dehydrogenase/diacetyl reductase